MQNKKIKCSILRYMIVLFGCLMGVFSYPRTISSRQPHLATPTQDMVTAVQAGDIERVKKLWLHYHNVYVDKAAIFKSACIHKQYALIAWLLKTTTLAAQYQYE